MPKPIYTINLQDIDTEDSSLYGTTAAGLAQLHHAGVPTPKAFVLQTNAYRHLVSENNIGSQIKNHLQGLSLLEPKDLESRAQAIQSTIQSARLPEDMLHEIVRSYNKLGEGSLVAVSASPTNNSSRAAHQLKWHYLKGDANLFDTIRDIWAQSFTPEALFFRARHDKDHLDSATAIIVQAFNQPDVSGVMTTTNPVTDSKNTIVIEAVYGLPDPLATGGLTPDQYQIDKNTLELHHTQITAQHQKTIYQRGHTKSTKIKSSEADKPKLNKHQLRVLAELGQKIHQINFFPQEVFWTMNDSQFEIWQTRDLNKTNIKKSETEQKAPLNNLPITVTGDPASPGIATGHARIIKDTKQLASLKTGEILVAPVITPSFIPYIRKAAAIVTDIGGQITHGAVLAREFGLPAIVNTGTATKLLKTGQVYTINAATGNIYAGSPPTTQTKSSSKPESPIPNPESLPKKTATKLYLTTPTPLDPTTLGKLNSDGFGPLTSHLVFTDLNLHPKYLLENKKTKDLTKNLETFFTSFSHSFGNRPVFYQLSSFLSSSYARLKHGSHYEQYEPNPLLGFRGSLRHTTDPKIINLELRAFHQARSEGARNLNLIMPVTRNPKEAAEMKSLISAAKLIRSSTLKLYLLVSTPSMASDIESALEPGFDGVVVDFDSLLSHSQGYDYTNDETKQLLNPRDPLVDVLVTRLIKTVNKQKLDTFLTSYQTNLPHDLVEQFVDAGITGISTLPIHLDSLRHTIALAEHKKLQ